MIEMSERAKVAIDDCTPTLKRKVQKIIKGLENGEPFEAKKVRLKISDRLVHVIRIDAKIRLMYYKNHDNITILDLLNRSEYSHD